MRQNIVNVAWRIWNVDTKAAVVDCACSEIKFELSTPVSGLDAKTTAGISNADAKTEQSCAASTRVGIWSSTSNDPFAELRLG
jgi:hypothetical protein